MDSSLRAAVSSLTRMTLCGQCCRSVAQPPSVGPIDVLNGGRDTFVCRNRSLCFVAFLREYKLMVEVACEELAEPSMGDQCGEMEALFLPTVLDALESVSAVEERRLLLGEVEFLGGAGQHKILSVSSSSSEGDNLTINSAMCAKNAIKENANLSEALAHLRCSISNYLHHIESGMVALHTRKSNILFEFCREAMESSKAAALQNSRAAKQLESTKSLLDDQRRVLELERRKLLRVSRN